MNISNSQVKGLQHSARAGLHSLYRPEPQTAVEWADTHYYLPKESAYQEGRWETLPFQRAIMNAMGNDYIREVNVVKSARVGYSKMLLGVYAYFIEHKQRNSLIWLPTDGDAENFMKSHVEPTMADIPALEGIVTLMNVLGYDYQRDEDLALWSSADLKYSITYEM
ncbi:TPA: phage terminase large subunit family protein [Citrobacter amalonaticus]|nr:phage terminase large subunit family protein [Citrobacter amalonaticus]